MTLTPLELESINASMLNRGAPIKIDRIGYNKPDYTICYNYGYGLSNSQLADLASRLIKYCNTQVQYDVEVMKETAEYFTFLANESSLEDSVSILNIGKEMTEITFRYDAEIIKIIKTANKRKYNPENKTWFIANNEVISIFEKLQNSGYDTKNAVQYFEDNKPEEITQENDKIIIDVKENKDKLIISFSYNPEIVNAIKSLEYRKYNPSEKTWTINKSDANVLINKLASLTNVDYSSLTPFTNDELIKKETTIPLIDTTSLKRKPFAHQIEAANFLLKNKKAILADEMGGGKTLSSLLASESIPGKKLVVCPASVKYNWQDEIKMISKLPSVIIESDNWINCNGYTIINYDILCKNIEHIEKSNFAVVIFDEAHYGKAVNNSGKPGSKRAEMMLRISKQIEYAFLLTGTPITNRAKDIFNLLKCCNHYLSHKFFPFGKRYCDGKHNGYGWDFSGYSNQEELNEKMKTVMMRRLKSELLDLPEKIRSFIPCMIDLRQYNNKLQEYMDNRETFKTQGEHLVYLNAMRMILAKEKANNTITFIKDILEQDKPVVVFTCYDSVLDRIEEKFGNIVARLDGSVPAEKRQQLVKDFQAGKYKVFASNIIAGGVGITLTASDIVIFNDYDWTPSNHAQAEDRPHRIGQKNTVNIYYMYAKGATSDEKITELIGYKLQNINQIIDGKNESFVNELIDSL